MTDDLTLAVTVASVVGCGLVAGLLFAFSAFMMRALDRLPAAQGIAAMQSINVAILNPVFLLLFLGTTGLSVVLAVSAPFIEQPGDGWRVGGGLLYLVGVFVVTGAANVPLNNALADADPDSPEGVRIWERYQSRWTAWNHVRTLAATGATIALAIAA